MVFWHSENRLICNSPTLNKSEISTKEITKDYYKMFLQTHCQIGFSLGHASYWQKRMYSFNFLQLCYNVGNNYFWKNNSEVWGSILLWERKIFYQHFNDNSKAMKIMIWSLKILYCALKTKNETTTATTKSKTKTKTPLPLIAA